MSSPAQGPECLGVKKRIANGEADSIEYMCSPQVPKYHKPQKVCYC